MWWPTPAADSYAGAGQRPDAPQALPLLAGLPPAYLIADRGYDADPLVALAARGTYAGIPPAQAPPPAHV